MKRKFIIIIILAVLSSISVFSQTINKPKLDSLFSILAENNKAMGTLTISKNGFIVYNKAIGYSFYSDKEKKGSSTNTRYRIGSITKIFTATMIFQLVEEGKITLGTTLDKYFPEIPNAKIITISNLLNHRSGLHNFTADTSYLTWMIYPKTQEEMLSMFNKFKVDFQPDEKSEYSNTNYVILGYIIEKITQQSYSENLNKRITSKIGLSNTYCGSKINLKKNECYSYYWYVNIKNWVQQSETDMSFPGGAGSIVSTPADLTKFIEALFSFKLVSQNSLEQMKPETEGYGMGLIQMSFAEKKAYGHTGLIDGFFSNLYYFPEDKLAISYCTNANYTNYSSMYITDGVMGICFSKNFSLPEFYSITNTKELDPYLGDYSSKEPPLKIKVFKDNLTLIAKIADQSPVLLEVTGKDIFTTDQGKLVSLEFHPEKKEMTFKQDEKISLFTKDSNSSPKGGDSYFGSVEEQINNFTGYLYYIPNTTMKLPDFDTLTLVGKIYTNYLNVKNQDYLIGFPGVTDRYDYFAIDYKGKFYIKDPDEYCFLLGSDDGSKLFIDDKLVVDNDYAHGIEYKVNCTTLEKGSHKIEVQYYQGHKPWVALILKYRKSSEKDYQVFDLTKFYPITVNDKASSTDVSIGDEILFAFNSYELSEVAKNALSEIKRVIMDKIKIKSIIIEGHTDDVGSDAYNMTLSINRAKAVKDYFASIGVDPTLIVTKGYGKTKPKTPNIDDASRKQNRRIEISIIKVK
jgi:D-alanyl-D-alanine carboxypeptidase